jgi:methyl-accepting chemotaxis protein
MAIRYKLGLIIFGLSLIIMSMFLVTWYTTSAQKADGLVINLAGRQRMLSQKMSKELLTFASETDTKLKEKLKSSTLNTVKVFDITLIALADSGKAPLSLNLKGEYADCPKAVEPALSQLNKVKKIWKDFSSHMNNALSGKTTSLKYIEKNNITLLKEMNKAVGMLQKISEKKIKNLIIYQTIGLMIGLVLVVISALQIAAIVKNLMQSASTAKHLRKGNLTKRFDIADKPTNKLDELDFLGLKLNEFAQALQDNMENIYQEAQTLNSSSSEMNNVAVELSDETDKSAKKTSKVAEQTETMGQDMNAVAAAMEELSANTQQIANSTSKIRETSSNISHNADKASEITAKAVEKVESASSRVDDLGDAAKKIDNVSETITDISTQTNLLALNATIEAARAGEAGKGFAVVANEIKNLANETTEATQLIKENIEWIQGSTSSTVEDIKEITQVINEVNAIVTNISSAVEEQTSAFSEINTNINEGAQAVQEVSSNIANTSAVALEIAEDVNVVNRSISNVSSNATNIAASSEQLSSLAKDLDKMVSFFTIK